MSKKHQVPTSVEYTNHKIYSSYSKTSPPCLLVRPQIMLFCKLPTHVTQCVVPHDSRGTRPGFPPSASSHLAALIPSPCVSAPFPVRLACLANLPLCLYVNLTSWQAYWSASKMTWLAGGSILLFAAGILKSFLSGRQQPGSARDAHVKRHSPPPCLVCRYGYR